MECAKTACPSTIKIQYLPCDTSAVYISYSTSWQYLWCSIYRLTIFYRPFRNCECASVYVLLCQPPRPNRSQDCRCLALACQSALPCLHLPLSVYWSDLETSHHRAHGALIIMETLIISTVHFSYVLRIWKLTPPERKILPCLLTLLAAATVACELSAVSSIFGAQSFADFPGFKLQLFLSTGSTCLADVAISVSLICFLAQNRTGYSWTDSTVTVLYSYALNSGVFASLLSTAALISLCRVDTSLDFEAIRIVLATVHVNSFIAMLNARYYFQPRNMSSTIVLQAHETSINISKFGDVRATNRNPGYPEGLPTINDAGLPLFSAESAHRSDLPKVLEVAVAQEQHSM